MVYLHFTGKVIVNFPEGATFPVKHHQQNFLLLVLAAMVE
jgi:hypothetical protein